MENEKMVLENLKKAKQEDPTDPISAYQYCQAYDRYYKDMEAKIKVYETFVADFPKDAYVPLAQARISDLKKEQFLNGKK